MTSISPGSDLYAVASDSSLYHNVVTSCYGGDQQQRAYNHIIKNDPVLRSLTVNQDHTIDLPAKDDDSYPHSIIQLGVDFQSSVYYVNYTQERIEIFFGDYLPLYDVNSMNVGKCVDDTSIFNGTRLSFGRTFDATVLHSYTIDFDVTAVISSTPTKLSPSKT